METSTTPTSPTAQPLVRQATLSDLHLLAPLFDAYRQFYQQAADLALARAFLRERLALQESVIFLAGSAHEQALGFTQLYPSFTSVGASRTWILNDLFVVPGGRGRGVGRALLEAARAHGLATGALRLDLATAHDNPAQKLYESQDYARNEGFYHYSLQLGQ